MGELGEITEVAGALADDLPPPKVPSRKSRRRRKRRKTAQQVEAGAAASSADTPADGDGTRAETGGTPQGVPDDDGRRPQQDSPAMIGGARGPDGPPAAEVAIPQPSRLPATERSEPTAPPGA